MLRVFTVFSVFRVFKVFRVNDIWESQQGDQRGGPKMAGVKFQHFGPPLRPKKMLLTTEKVGSAQN